MIRSATAVKSPATRAVEQTSALWRGPVPFAVSPRVEREAYRAVAAIEQGMLDHVCTGLGDPDATRRAVVTAAIAQALTPAGQVLIVSTASEFLAAIQRRLDTAGSAAIRLLDDPLDLASVLINEKPFAAIVDAARGFGRRDAWRYLREHVDLAPVIWLGASHVELVRAKAAVRRLDPRDAVRTATVER